MKNKRNIFIIALAVFLLGVGLPAVSSAVSVSAECAYTADDLVCYVYVDTEDGSIPGEELRSGGVKLSYNQTELLGPAGTTDPIAIKNEVEWYFGAGSQDPAFLYMDPETDTDGEVVFIVGVLDTTPGFEGVGVTGSRVHIGTVTFARATTNVPVDYPGTTFGLSLALGRTSPYVNFVNVGGDDLDAIGISFAPLKVGERGDAEGDGDIDVFDFLAVRVLLTTSGPYSVLADCEGDPGEDVDVFDFLCVRGKL